MSSHTALRSKTPTPGILMTCFLGLGLFAVIGRCATNTYPSPVLISEFSLDGRTWRYGSNVPAPGSAAEAPRRISAGNHQIEFGFGANPASTKRAIRFRYRLEGYEAAWYEIGDPMRFVVHFRDAESAPVGSADFAVRGESPGWTGRLETSRFIERREIVVVPKRTTNARIWIPSGGNPDTVGVFLVDDLRVTRLSQENAPQEELLHDDFEAGRDLDSPLGVLDGWVRDGTSLSIAQIVRTGPNEKDHSLALIDDDPDKFAAWLADDKRLLQVNPGEKLLFEWKEMFSVGGGGHGVARYHNLPPGDYRFKVVAISEFGVPTGSEAVWPFRIVPPLYAREWFRAMSGLLAIALLIGGVRYAARRRLQLKLERMRFKNLLEKERTRIAQDIHDDLGTKLSRVSLLSEAVRRDAGAASPFAAGLDEISATAKETIRTLDEIVWAIDPEQDSLDSLVSYLGSFAQDLLKVAGLRCRIDFPTQLPPWVLFADVRHNLFLAFSEVLNNVIKHARATEVNIGLELGASDLVLSIADNGCGFDMGRLAAHEFNETDGPRHYASGLINLQKRLEKLKGQLEVQSQPGEGTRVTFRLPAERFGNSAINYLPD